MITSIYRVQPDGIRHEWRLIYDRDSIAVMGLWWQRKDDEGHWAYLPVDGNPDIPEDVVEEARVRFRKAEMPFDRYNFEKLREGRDPDRHWPVVRFSYPAEDGTLGTHYVLPFDMRYEPYEGERQHVFMAWDLVSGKHRLFAMKHVQGWTPAESSEDYAAFTAMREAST